MRGKRFREMSYGMIVILGIGGAVLLALLCCAVFMELMNRRLAAYQAELAEKQYEEVEDMYRQMQG